MILALEGASAVSKTTAARALVERHGAYAVAEVNALFERPLGASPDWYLERQAERCRIAQARAADHPMAVLDGDVLQPLWCNWAFAGEGFQPLDAVAARLLGLVALEDYAPFIPSGDDPAGVECEHRLVRDAVQEEPKHRAVSAWWMRSGSFMDVRPEFPTKGSGCSTMFPLKPSASVSSHA